MNGGEGESDRERLVSIDDILHARPYRPADSTRDRGWSGVTIDCFGAFQGLSERYVGLDHHLITYCRSGSHRLVQSRAGVVHDGVVSSGMSYLMPSGYDSAWEGDTGPTARLRVPTALVAMSAEQLGRRSVSQVELRNVFEVHDPVIERFALCLLGEMELRPHPAQALIVDSISTALVVHLLRRYNAFELAPELRD